MPLQRLQPHPRNAREHLNSSDIVEAYGKDIVRFEIVDARDGFDFERFDGCESVEIPYTDRPVN